MNNFGVYKRNVADVNAISDEKLLSKWLVYKLPNNIFTEADFWQAMRFHLPLDPPLSSTGNKWDALEDSLWEGLHELKVPGVVIIWPNPILLQKNDPRAYQTAVEIFESISKTICDPKYGGGWTTNVIIFLVT